VYREHGNLEVGEGVAALGVYRLGIVRLRVTVIGIVGRVSVGSKVSVDVAKEMLSRRVARRYCSISNIRDGIIWRLVVGESCYSGSSVSMVALS